MGNFIHDDRSETIDADYQHFTKAYGNGQKMVSSGVRACPVDCITIQSADMPHILQEKVIVGLDIHASPVDHRTL